MSTTISLLTKNEECACIALSELFQDTELLPIDIAYIVKTLHGLDLSWEQLDGILRKDVFPVLYPNRLSIAGVWTSFAEDWLIGEISNRRADPWNIFQVLGGFVAWTLFSNAITSSWREVKAKIYELEQKRIT
ncbi:hypothetical protein F5884DRAFT_855620 [Xylogone sp. PMI_703]|nr:hypothetical protein F5884DRAFT_855620 [Xylogone sp. PMI_703]